MSSWVTVVHFGFMAWTVLTAHYPALFVGGFLVFLGFAKATSPYQSRIELKGPLLVGFFLAGWSSTAASRRGGLPQCSAVSPNFRCSSPRPC